MVFSGQLYFHVIGGFRMPNGKFTREKRAEVCYSYIQVVTGGPGLNRKPQSVYLMQNESTSLDRDG